METAVDKCFYFPKTKHLGHAENNCKVDLQSACCRRECSPRSGGTTFSCSTASEDGQVPDGLSMLLEQLFVATAPAAPICEKVIIIASTSHLFLYAGHNDYTDLEHDQH